MFGRTVQVMQREGGNCWDVTINIIMPPPMPERATTTWPNQMRPGRTYHLLSRQTTTTGYTYESWYEEGGGTGDVVNIETPPEWAGQQPL